MTNNMVLVTTASGGVWVGDLVRESGLVATLSPSPGISSVTIRSARLCLADSSLGEVMPLAYDGPGERHIGEVMPWVVLFDVTAVICCTVRATEAWSERMVD